MKRRFSAETFSNRKQQLFEGLRESECMDAVASYLSRGRILCNSSTDNLEARWRESLRLHCTGGDFDPAMESIYAELTLRGVNQVELPQDLQMLIVGRYERFQEEIESDSELRMALLERLFEFAEALRQPKN